MKSLLIVSCLLLSNISFACEAPIADQAPLKKVKIQNSREILAAPGGLTVYVFDRDISSESTCYGGCEKAWPPVLRPAQTALGKLVGTTTRKDGKVQLTLNGKPIYFYAGDAAEGEINGDGLGGVWHIIGE